MENKSKGLEFFEAIYKWKNFIFINTFILVAIVMIISYIIPEEYKAKAVVTTPPENYSALSGLTGLMSSKGGSNLLGAKMFGLGGANTDFYYGILNSRTVLLEVANKFDLWSYYKVDKNNPDKLLKKFTKDVSFEPNEFDFIEISVLHENPEIAAKMANYFVQLLDSLNIKYNNETAKNNRIFIENRYLKNVEDLKNAEEKMHEFQKKYKVVVVPEQLEISFKMAAELEAQALQQEVQTQIMKQTLGENNPQYKVMEQQLKLLKDKIERLKNDNQISESNVLLPFKNLPNVSIEYFRLYREIQIQTKIMEILLPMYEQAKVEENKNIPTIAIIDYAVPPSQKYYPKRSLFFIAALFLTLFVFIILSLIFNKSLSNDNSEFEIQRKINKYAKSIISFYRIV